MHRNDTSMFLLYMEPVPHVKTEAPLEDAVTLLMAQAIADSKAGTANYSDDNGNHSKVSFGEGNGYRGIHWGADGVHSTNQDYLLETGHVTNSLSVHYVKYYRSYINEHDINKIIAIGEHYGIKIGPEMFEIAYVDLYMADLLTKIEKEDGLTGETGEFTG